MQRTKKKTAKEGSTKSQPNGKSYGETKLDRVNEMLSKVDTASIEAITRKLD